MPTNEPTTSAIPPDDVFWAPTPVPLEDAVDRSVLVVVATATSVDNQRVTVQVDEVLRAPEGDVPSHIDVTWPEHSIEPGTSGVWVLGLGDPMEVLPANGPRADRREVERLLAGLPRLDPRPSEADMRALAEEADAVAFVRITSHDGITADAEPVEMLRGELPPAFVIRRGDVPIDEPGGPWTLPTDAPAYVVAFLRAHGDEWVVLNSSDPTLVTIAEARDALAN